MLTIRLQRRGKKNAAHFSIVVAEKAAHVSKKITELLGSYNPASKEFKVNDERVQYWIAQHVEMSPTVHNMFVDKGLVKSDKVKAFSVPKKVKEVPAATAPVTSEAAPAATAAAEATTPEAPVADTVETPSVTPDETVTEAPAETAPAQPAEEIPKA